MKTNRLASKASPGEALSKSFPTIPRIVSQSLGDPIGCAKALLTRLAVLTAGLATTSQLATAAALTLAWNANPETNITGYKVSYGTSSGAYPNVVNVGTSPTTSISGLTEGSTYYFVVSALNQAGLQSPLSSQISYQVPSTVPTNQAPVALAKSVSTNEDTPLPITLSGTDTENNPLTYSIVSGPTKGTLSGIAPNVTYSPSADFNGSDSFTFRVNDGTVNSAAATISISVTPVNDAPVATAKTVATPEDTPLSVVLAGSDKDLNSLTFSVVTGPSKGTLAGTAPNLTYSPAANFVGSDQFTFRVNDGTVNSATATVSITVTTVNDAPVALGKSVGTSEDTPVAITLAGSDPENNPLSYSIVSGPTKGSLSGTAPNLTYSPSADLNGSDSFTFRVNDGTANSATATISISIAPVNDAPVATSKSVTTTEDTPLPIVLAGSDKDLNTLTFSVVTGPSNGTLSGTAPNLTYSPAKNFNGSDQFTFRVNDGTVNSATATISITVATTNDVPVALANSLTTAEDTPLPIVLGGTDSEGSTLTFSILSSPTKGTLSGTAPNISYSPSANFNGGDSFTFVVNDGLLNSQPATVSITVTPVNDAPVANSIVVETPAGSARAFVLGGGDVEGSSLTFSVVGSPTKGTLSGTAPNLTYLPNPGVSGSDQLTFKTSDGILTSSLATVSFTITPPIVNSQNLAPVFSADPISLNGVENAPVTGQLVATDANAGDTLTYTKASGPPWLIVSTSGVLGGIPGNSNVGTNSFVVRVADQAGAFDEAALKISVANVNQPPAFISNPILVADASENASYSGQTLAGKAIDYDAGDSITYSKVAGPAWLNVAVNGALSGTPPAGSAGLNSFVVRAADNFSAIADVELRINVSGLPLPWTTSDLGTGQLAGSITHNLGVFTQAGSGALGGVSDQLRFTYQTLSGDGSITAKVSLEQNSGPNCFAGVMIRSSMAPKSTQVFVGLTNDSSYQVASRVTSGGRNSVKGFGRDGNRDTWVRLVHNTSKKMVFAYKSSDGVYWTYFGATKLTLPSFCQIGLAVSSGSNSTLCTAKFSNVYVNP